MNLNPEQYMMWVQAAQREKELLEELSAGPSHTAPTTESLMAMDTAHHAVETAWLGCRIALGLRELESRVTE